MGPDGSHQRLHEMAARVAGSHGLELFDLQFRRESTGWVLRVILDRPWTPGTAGTPGTDVVGIEDCQRVSQDLSALLDVEEERLGLPDVKYTLEVSSPGLDRPLRGGTDYARFQGRLAKIVTAEPVEGQTSFAGRLAGLDEGHVLLVEGRRTHRVPVARIKRARLEVEF
jgi:ribosome maturation factor RimP